MKKIKNKKLESVLAFLVELIEFTIISLIAVKLLNTSIIDLIIILLTFFISRFRIGSAGHYKIVSYFDAGWRRCFFWTASLILSLCLTAKLGILIGFLFTIFTSYIISGKANIQDISLGWKAQKQKGKYYDIEEYVKYNEMNNELLEFEEKLKKKDNLLYLIYKYRFKENLTFAEISERLDIDSPRIVEKLDTIAFSIRIYCGI